MKITSIKAIPLSFRLPEGKTVTMGVGSTTKRDTIIVKVETSEGITGYGEAHPGRSPGAVVSLLQNTLAPMLIGMAATDVVGVWQRVHRMQLSSHGVGSGAALALAGIDMALWDIRGKAANMPLYALLGGSKRRVPAYAGGISLGFQPKESLAEEAQGYVARGYRAIKLRLGDNARNDIDRVLHVRKVLGDDIDILTDANTNYTMADPQAVSRKGVHSAQEGETGKRNGRHRRRLCASQAGPEHPCDGRAEGGGSWTNLVCVCRDPAELRSFR